MEYKIVTGSTPAGFAREVEAQLGLGFELRGAPFVYGNLLCQAITRDASPEAGPSKEKED